MPKKTNKKPKPHTKRQRKLRVPKNWPLWLLLLALSAFFGGFIYIKSAPRYPLLPKPPSDAPYKQVSQPLSKRVDDLLSRMTLDEKIGQMALVDKGSLKKTVDISRYNLGGVLSGAGAKPANNTPEGWLKMVSEKKDQAKQSRLGIPLLYGIDANHGNGNVPGSTVFPHAIGLGAANDAQLTQQVATATAEEIKATGINWSFSPSLDAPNDIRWGRVYEAFSSDPNINASLGAAYVNGTQQTQVLATAKHFFGTGSMIWGKSNNKDFRIDQGVVAVDDAALQNKYLVPYTAAAKAEVATVMVGLTFWGDKRIIDDRSLLTDKLKNELGFKGFVVSDWYGTYEYSKTSNYQANIKTINAGLDMAMLPFDYKNFISDVHKAVERHEIPQSRIDDAVKRILTQKFKAGLFDESATATPPINTIGSQTHRQLARQTVAASAVLLKNQKDVLPLAKQGSRIFVAGSGADNVGRQCGAWTVEWQGIDGNWLPGSTSVLAGLRQVAPDNSIEYNKLANFNGKADVAIAVVSEKPYAEGWGDNANPHLEDADLKVIEKLKAVSNKVIVVIVSGRPLILSDKTLESDAIVAAWLPGSEGAGVADLLFGNKLFTAKLPVVWPTNINQDTALYERGYGLKTEPTS